MERQFKTFSIVAAGAIFIGLPVLFYTMGDVPRRSAFKEALSVLTILAFMLMLGQFYLARSNVTLLALFKPQVIQRVHKYIAYTAIGFFLLHPFLIVLPRYFEAGVKPIDALITLLTTFDNLGVVLGLIAWGLMLVLGATAMFRMRMIKRFSIKYRNWRYFHGALTVGFVGVALWHSIELGRHTDMTLSALMIALAAAGVALLLRLYRDAIPLCTLKSVPTLKGAK
ncbi:ferric reductase-like transmembrane domain-containing protein [Shimia sp.]|uniref:ferric reductase-like transmembrane domain-containing protein n=1 Tax=Shimia sp. TaxID=1954381 RepID=UPI00329948A1